MAGRPPEGAHGHAESHGDDLVDGVRIQANVHQQAGRLCVGEEDSVDCEPSAVAHHHRCLLDLGTEFQGVQNDLFRTIQRL